MEKNVSKTDEESMLKIMCALAMHVHVLANSILHLKEAHTLIKAFVHAERKTKSPVTWINGSCKMFTT